MSSVVPYESIRNALVNAMSPTYPVVEYDEIDPVLEQSSAPFISLEEVPSLEELAAFGDPTSLCMRETGAILVYCFMPAPESSNAVRVMAETVRDFLRNRTIGDTVVESVAPPDMELMNNGLWSVAVIIVSYRYDFHAPKQ